MNVVGPAPRPFSTFSFSAFLVLKTANVIHYFETLLRRFRIWVIRQRREAYDPESLRDPGLDAAEMLWLVVANVSGGDWTKQSTEWQEAAVRWRDNYYSVLAMKQMQERERRSSLRAKGVT